MASKAPSAPRSAGQSRTHPTAPLRGPSQVLKSALGPRVRVVGCSPANSDVMRASVAAGRIVDAPWRDTISDATAGGIEEGAVTLAPCMAAVDEWCAGRGYLRRCGVAFRGHSSTGESLGLSALPCGCSTPGRRRCSREVRAPAALKPAAPDPTPRVNVSEQEIADAMASLLHHHSKLVEGAAGCAVAALWRQRGELAGRRAVALCCGGNVSLKVLADVLQRGRVLPGGPGAGAAGPDPLGPPPKSLPGSG
jgi:hypothetical protein